MQDFRENSSFNATKSVCEDTGTLTSFSAVLFLLGLPACVAVFWELFQKHRKGFPTTPNDVFMISLTAMDMIFLFSIPLKIVTHNFSWLAVHLDIYTEFLYVFNLYGRPLFMTCICLDCYLAVVHPMTYRKRRSLTSRGLISVGVWVATAIYGIIQIFVGRIVPQIELLCITIALPIIGFCDFSIIWTLKRSDPGGRDLHPQKKKAFQIVINSLVMTVISYLPAFLMGTFGTLLPRDEAYSCFLGTTAVIISTAGSAMMPILYLGNMGKLDCIRVKCRKTVYCN